MPWVEEELGLVLLSLGKRCAGLQGRMGPRGTRTMSLMIIASSSPMLLLSL